MQIIKISPRGYCYGVVDAMVIARNAALDKSLPRPIYILGMIVHNKHVTDAFEDEGIITLDGSNRLEILEKVQSGTVIFTAHGVSPEVRKIASEKGLVTLDATCPDVTKTHDLIRAKKAEGYHVIYIGKKSHPEPEGAVHARRRRDDDLPRYARGAREGTLRAPCAGRCVGQRSRDRRRMRPRSLRGHARDDGA